METLTKINPQEFGLKETEVATIEAAFMPKIAERDGLKEVYSQILSKEITPQVCEEAKSIRLKLVKVRTGIAEIHKTQKAFFLAAGRFVDAWKNKETEPVLQMEENLTTIEEYYARIEAKRIAELQETRAAEMAKYEADFIPGNLGELTDQVWNNFILGTKTAYEAKKAAEKAAAEAEAKRIAEEKAEQERIRLENEKLQKELKEQEEKAAAEKATADKLLKEQQAKAEAEAKKAAEKLAAEQAAAKAAAEQAAAEKAKLEAELKAKAEAEAAKLAEEAAKAEAELAKGDAAKIQDLISDLESLKTKYSFKSASNRKKYADVAILLDKVINHIQK